MLKRQESGYVIDIQVRLPLCVPVAVIHGIRLGYVADSCH